MNSCVSISAPRAAGKTQFAEALEQLVKLFYGDAATVARSSIQGHTSSTLSFDLDMDKMPSYHRQRAVVAQMKALRTPSGGAVNNLCAEVMGQQPSEAVVDKLRAFGLQAGCASEDTGSLCDCVRRHTLPFGGFPASRLVISEPPSTAERIIFDMKRGILQIGSVTLSMVEEPARREFNGTKNMGHSH